jgi:hypothetical protein
MAVLGLTQTVRIMSHRALFAGIALEIGLDDAVGASPKLQPTTQANDAKD